MTRYVKKEFDKVELSDMLWSDSEELSLIEDEIIDTSRWSEIHEVVFQENITGDYYTVNYSCGATEFQDEAPFENDPDMVECTKVEKVKITVDSYKMIEDNS